MIHPLIFTEGSQTLKSPVEAMGAPWPFAKEHDHHSVFQRLIQRVSGPGFHPPVVVACNNQVAEAQRQIDEIGVTVGDWLITSEGGKAEALRTAAQLKPADRDALFLVLPCDHQIEDEVSFLRSLASAASAAHLGACVSFGVAPKTVAPGKGVLRVEAREDAVLGIVALEALSAEGFAEDLVQGEWLWNTGIALGKAESLMHLVEEESWEAEEAVHKHLTPPRDLVAIELGCGWSGAPGTAGISPQKKVSRDCENAGVLRLARADRDGWGYHETLSSGPRFQVRRMMVEPGAALPLQSHVHRSEHWVVVSGSAMVTIAGDARLLTENENVFIPLGVVHSLENPGKLPLHLIKVQSGCYLGEDDLVIHDNVRDCIEVA